MRQEVHEGALPLNFAYEPHRWLTKVTYRGREAAIAVELGRLLRYGKKGSNLVEMITDRWTDLREGKDYELLKGPDLRDFLAALSRGDRTTEKIRQLMILYTSGISLVLMHTEKPVGDKLRRWLADEVFPSLRERGKYTLDPSDHKALPASA